MEKKHIAALTAVALIAASVSLCLVWKRKQERSGNAPPANAPQLDVANPGDQSEFPAAPANERDLG